MKLVDNDNLHSVDAYGHPLGIVCECGRRALLGLDVTRAHRGSMKLIRDLKLVCRECGSRKFVAFLFIGPCKWKRSKPVPRTRTSST